MTEKLFWNDPYQTEFTATVQERFAAPDGPAAVLDRTCFYATSGGQPNDLGELNSVRVKDVRVEDGKIVHVLERELAEDSVSGKIEWRRRWDHMQQHSGQHILSAAFFRLYHAETSSFHLGEQYCSIELSKPDLNEKQLTQAEQLANDIVCSAMPVQSFFVEPGRAGEYPLRKQSDLAESLRIIQIGDYDLSPCSGTHVKNTGEIGVIFIHGFEKLSQTCRITFLCGNRVRSQYHQEVAILKALSKKLTTSVELLPDSVTKLLSQVKELRKENTQLKEKRLKAEAMELLVSSETWHDMHLLVKCFDRPYEEIRYLAQRLAEQPGVLGALASTSEHRLVFFKHPAAPFDLKSAFASFLTATGARGGGPAHFLEAGSIPADPDLQQKMHFLFR